MPEFQESLSLLRVDWTFVWAGALMDYLPADASTMLRSLTHLVLHAALPAAAAWFFFRDQWKRAWLIMFATMVVDLDHLLADPIYDPGRCSVGFHPLHSYPAIAGYLLLTLPPPTRLLGFGLVIHMALDAVDCLFM